MATLAGLASPLVPEAGMTDMHWGSLTPMFCVSGVHRDFLHVFTLRYAISSGTCSAYVGSVLLLGHGFVYTTCTVKSCLDLSTLKKVPVRFNVAEIA